MGVPRRWVATSVAVVFVLCPYLSPSSSTASAQTLRPRLEAIASGFNQPTHVTSAGDGSGRLFLLEQAGRILIVRGGQVLPRPFLDLHDRVGSSQFEQGLLGVAFHPHFAENGWFYVNYTDLNGDTVIARYAVSADADLADPTSATLILHIPQPAANHNGGLLLFGPDGYLWIGTGDGGGAGAEFPRAQDLSLLLGKMLRLDVDADLPYAIPADNPFVDIPGILPEIWGFGLRNPWRYSFDRESGDLYIGDVGQDLYEWINFVPAGSVGGMNFGWPVTEGLHCQPAGLVCDRAGLQAPVAEYDHSLGCAIVGGNVYRGAHFPGAWGTYVFGDFCSGRIWSLQRGDEDWRLEDLLATGFAISSFGEDDEGELYLVARDRGALFLLTF